MKLIERNLINKRTGRPFDLYRDTVCGGAVYALRCQLTPANEPPIWFSTQRAAHAWLHANDERNAQLATRINVNHAHDVVVDHIGL